MRIGKSHCVVYGALITLAWQLFIPMARAEEKPVLLNELVDRAKITADAWQNDTEADPPAVFPPADALARTSISADSGIPAADIRRFCSSLNVNYAHHQGAPTIVDGVATTSLILPFTQTVELEELQLVFSVAPRRYYFNLYTSMDGSEWKFAELDGGAESIHLLEAYNEKGEVVDIAEKYVGCCASDPAGAQGEYDKVSTLTLKEPAAAKFLKITLYGNDGASGENKVRNQWVSFNHLELYGADTVKSTEKPVQSFVNSSPDGTPSEEGLRKWGIWAAVGAAVVAAGVILGIVLVKKRKK